MSYYWSTRQPLFQIFTQANAPQESLSSVSRLVSINAIDVTRVTLSCFNSMMLIDGADSCC